LSLGFAFVFAFALFLIGGMPFLLINGRCIGLFPTGVGLTLFKFQL
jgi:hypothetical protein